MMLEQWKETDWLVLRISIVPSPNPGILGLVARLAELERAIMDLMQLERTRIDVGRLTVEEVMLERATIEAAKLYADVRTLQTAAQEQLAIARAKPPA